MADAAARRAAAGPRLAGRRHRQHRASGSAACSSPGIFLAEFVRKPYRQRWPGRRPGTSRRSRGRTSTSPGPRSTPAGARLHAEGRHRGDRSGRCSACSRTSPPPAPDPAPGDDQGKVGDHGRDPQLFLDRRSRLGRVGPEGRARTAAAACPRGRPARSRALRGSPPEGRRPTTAGRRPAGGRRSASKGDGGPVRTLTDACSKASPGRAWRPVPWRWAVGPRASARAAAGPTAPAGPPADPRAGRPSTVRRRPPSGSWRSSRRGCRRRRARRRQ